MKCIGPAVERQRDAIRKKLFIERLDKEILEYLFVKTLLLYDLSFNLVLNHKFCTWLEYVNSAKDDLVSN